MQRKRFLLGTISGLALVADTQHVFARALAQPVLRTMPDVRDRCLVVINLQGGNDGLNCVIPYADQRYYQLRPTLSIPSTDVLALDAKTGLNPKLRPLKALYDRGCVAIVQGVGYPNASYSHFRSTEIWQTAAPDRFEHTGWLGRYFDDADLPAGLFNGIAIAQTLPEVLASERTDIPAIDGLSQYGLDFDRQAATGRAFSQAAQDRRLPFTSPYLARVMEVETSAQRGSEELPKLVAGYRPLAAYPSTPLGRSLALAAQIVGSRLGTRVLYVQHGSFDTHSNQRAVQDRVLEQFAGAVSAFYTDLAAHGDDHRVLTMTFSEFGRRIAENGSHGTDHGEASPLFLIGGGVKGGMYGAPPDLGSSDIGNVRFTTDFRSVYATVLERWLGRPSQKLLQGAFPTVSALA